MTRGSRTDVDTTSGALPPEQERPSAEGPSSAEDRAALEALVAKLQALKERDASLDASEGEALLAPRIVQSAGPQDDNVSKRLDEDPIVDPVEAELQPHASGLPEDAEPD